MRLTVLLLFAMIMITNCSRAQKAMPLYDGDIPNSIPAPDEELSEVRENGVKIVSKISRPTLTAYLPADKSKSRTAVVICPGGGYWVNAISHEGTDVAKKFNEMGIAAFVLKYRIPDDKTMKSRETGPLQDVQQAISHVRSKAAEYGIDPQRIGVMGFSAGGHLASTAGTHFNRPVLNYPVSVRPDFLILIYPVISFQNSVGHTGSRNQLIGKEPSNEMINLYSNELQVTAETPPTFLVHASDDGGVKPENSVAFYSALIANNVPAELHIYQKGGHGFGMNNKTTKDQWMERCINWMRSNGW